MKRILIGFVSFALSLSSVAVAYAQPEGGIPTASPYVSNTIGSNITNVGTLLVWLLNTLAYLGWTGVIIGVGVAIFGLVYKLMNSESEEAIKKVQGIITKAVLIVVAGILLVSFRFIIKTAVSFIPGLTGTITILDEDVVPL